MTEMVLRCVPGDLRIDDAGSRDLLILAGKN